MEAFKRWWRLRVNVPATACSIARTNTSTLVETDSAINAICQRLELRFFDAQNCERKGPIGHRMMAFCHFNMSDVFGFSPSGFETLRENYSCWALDKLSPPILRLRLKRLARDTIRRLNWVVIWPPWGLGWIRRVLLLFRRLPKKDKTTIAPRGTKKQDKTSTKTIWRRTGVISSYISLWYPQTGCHSQWSYCTTALRTWVTFRECSKICELWVSPQHSWSWTFHMITHVG